MATNQQIANRIQMGVATALVVGAVLGGFAWGRVTTPAPSSCIQALETADEAMRYSSAAFLFASQGNIAGMDQASSGLKTITPEYKSTSSECRGGK